MCNQALCAGLYILTQTPSLQMGNRSELPVSWLSKLAFPFATPSNYIHLSQVKENFTSEEHWGTYAPLNAPVLNGCTEMLHPICPPQSQGLCPGLPRCLVCLTAFNQVKLRRTIQPENRHGRLDRILSTEITTFKNKRKTWNKKRG